MSMVPSALHIITSNGSSGRCGMTATAVLSVSDEPPTILISVNRASVSAQRIIANEAFCANALGAADQSLADVFAGRTALQRGERFTVGDWRELATGSPVLATAQAAFDCRIVSVIDVATHQLLVGEVLATHCATNFATNCSTHDTQSLIYLNRSFMPVRNDCVAR